MSGHIPVNGAALGSLCQGQAGPNLTISYDIFVLDSRLPANTTAPTLWSTTLTLCPRLGDLVATIRTRAVLGAAARRSRSRSARRVAVRRRILLLILLLLLQLPLPCPSLPRRTMST